jgi:protein transport protein SEC24
MQPNSSLSKKVILSKSDFFKGGRILVFASNISNSGWGALTYRDDAKLYNSDKEKVILSPVSDIYVKLAEECIT